MHLFRSSFFAALLIGAFAGLAHATTASETGRAQLKPGAVLTFTFPEMPATYHADRTHQPDVARMTVLLPRNFDPRQPHPLLVFLNGGDGGDGSTLGVARALTEEQDFVCVSVPLFKRPPTSGPGADIVMRDPDGRYMWPFFRTMLARLDEAVPNLDRERRILGGFSNGAHATQALLDESDGEVARQFCAFLLVEGGGRLRQYDRLKGKRYLIVSSSAKSRPRAEQLFETAKAAGADAAHLAVDVGAHDFPRSAYPAIREWLRATVARSSP